MNHTIDEKQVIFQLRKQATDATPSTIFAQRVKEKCHGSSVFYPSLRKRRYILGSGLFFSLILFFSLLSFGIVVYTQNESSSLGKSMPSIRELSNIDQQMNQVQADETKDFNATNQSINSSNQDNVDILSNQSL